MKLTYEDRKFIRVLVTQDQKGNITLPNNDSIDKNKFYWIEVKPRDLSKDSTLNSGRKM